MKQMHFDFCDEQLSNSKSNCYFDCINSGATSAKMRSLVHFLRSDTVYFPLSFSTFLERLTLFFQLGSNFKALLLVS